MPAAQNSAVAGSSQLDHFINQVQTLSANGATSQLAACVHQAAASGGLLSHLSSTEMLDNALQTLDLQLHSAAIAAILLCKLRALSANSQNANDLAVIRAQIAEFAAGCSSEQIRLVPDIFCGLFERLTEILLHKNEAHLGIDVVAKATACLRASRSQLTPLHAQLCCLCLKARCLKPALPFLDQNIDDILHMNQQPPHFNAQSFLCYYYYGGLIYTALKNYDRALFFFEVVLSTPASAVSAVMLEAYKKHVLVSLIVHGKVAPLPDYKSAVVARNIKPLAQEYHELADIVAASSQQQSSGTNTILQQAQYHISLHRNYFIKDSNLGLTKLVIESIVRANILRLTNTFITLSLVDVANRCHLSGGACEAEQYLLSMIDSNEINACIDQANGMVTFRDRSVSEVEAQCQIENCVRVEAQLRKLDTDTLLNPQFISRLTRGGGGGGGGSGLLHDDEGVSVGGSSMSAFGAATGDFFSGI